MSQGSPPLRTPPTCCRSEIVGSPIAVTIASPTGFTMNKETYRYCGPKVQF